MTALAAVLALALPFCAPAARFSIDAGVLTRVESEGGEAISVPDGVTEIADYAFSGVDAAGTVSLPASVASIGAYSFYRCSSLDAFDVAADNPCYKSVNGLLLTKDGKTLVAGVNGDVAIPAEVETVGEAAFAFREALTGVSAGERTTAIGAAAFYGCGALADAAFPGGVAQIGAAAFYGCGALAAIRIGDGAADVGAWAFAGCGALTEVSFPPGMAAIGEWAFYDCDGIRRLTFSGDAPAICGDLFWDAPDGCTARIPDSAAGYDVADGMWRGMTVEYYDLPPEIVVAGGVLTRVRPNGDTGILLPAGVSAIAADAFAGCGGLASLTLRGDAPSVAEGAFDALGGGCIVRIPDKAAGYEVIDGKWNGLQVERYPVAIIVFDSNGGALEISAAMVECGSGIGELPSPRRDGYAFYGWFTEKTDGERISPATIAAADAVYYAHWARIWFDEREATRNTTGSWSREVEYSNGRIRVCDERLAFVPAGSPPGRRMTVETTAGFDGYGTGEWCSPPDDAKAAVSIATNGCFQAWTCAGGEKLWMPLSGATARAGRDYCVRFDMDFDGGTYSVAVKESGGDGDFTALSTAGGGPLALAVVHNGGDAPVSGVVFSGRGSVISLRGLDEVSAAAFAQGDVVATAGGGSIALTAVQAQWLNSSGSRDAIAAAIAKLPADAVANAWLLNLDVADPSLANGWGTFSVVSIDVRGGEVEIAVRLVRNCARADGASAAPINGVLRLYAGETPAAATVAAAEAELTNATFAAGDEARIVVPASSAARFYRVAIEQETDRQ